MLGVAQPIPIDMRNAGRDPEKHDEMNRQGVGVGDSGDPAHTVTSAFVHAVAQPITYDSKQHHNPQPSDTAQLTTLNCAFVRGDTPLVQPTYAIQGSMIGRNDNAGPQSDGINVELFFTQNCVDRHAVAQPVAFQQTADCLTAAYGTKWNGNASATNGSLFAAQPIAFGGDIARTLQARHDSSPCADRGMDVIATAMQVRRLTPVECERLQGFPDGYTDIKLKGKPTPDGPRYKALGNSWAVPVVHWIGKRIQAQLEK
jgi:site-specific DNA-cytosine methylase